MGRKSRQQVKNNGTREIPIRKDFTSEEEKLKSIFQQHELEQNHESMRSVSDMTQQLNDNLAAVIDELSIVPLTSEEQNLLPAEQSVEEEQNKQQIVVEEFLEQGVIEETEQLEVSRPPVFINYNVTPTISKIFDWNDLLTYREFRLTMNGFWSEFKQNMDLKKQWDTSVIQTLNRMRQHIEYINYESRGIQSMEKVGNLLIDIFEPDLQQLQPLQMFAEIAEVQEVGLPDLLTELKAEIKNGTRVSYKMIQQLQTQLEELHLSPHVGVQDEINTVDAAAITSQQQLIDLTKELEELKKRQQQSMLLIIQAIDLLDLIKNSAQQSNLDIAWVAQIEQGIEKYLQQLKSFDIEEISALGEILDGNYMISLGNIPQESAPGFEKYQVCIVHERGYKEVSTGKVIREAKVISVY